MFSTRARPEPPKVRWRRRSSVTTPRARADERSDTEYRDERGTSGTPLRRAKTLRMDARERRWLHRAVEGRTIQGRTIQPDLSSVDPGPVLCIAPKAAGGHSARSARDRARGARVAGLAKS